MALTVTAVIPVWNGRVPLAKLLDTVEAQTERFAEVLVVDNGSSDGAPEMAAERGARVIRLGTNLGFAHAVNRGVAEAGTDSVAILNSDVELEPEWLERLAEARAPFATGRTVSMADPAVMDGSFDLLCRGGCPWRAGHGKRGTIPAQPIAIAPFTAVLFERKAFQTVGGLDEQFESYLEDVDFGLRCFARGMRGVYVPEAVCRHHGSATLGRWHGDSVRRMARNQLFLLAKHYPRPNPFSWPTVVAHTLWGGLAFRHGAGWDWIKGKWEGLRRFHEMPHAPVSGLAGFLEEQESLISDLQQDLGEDLYWRVYFGLTGAKRHRKAHE